jgi:hypothetical protein
VPRGIGAARCNPQASLLRGSVGDPSANLTEGGAQGFDLNGRLLRYQLAVPPPALPQLDIRETQGMVQVYTPPGPVA